METNTAETQEESLTLDIIHQSFETDFDALKQRLRIAEDNLHADTRIINKHITEIMQEERDQKRDLMHLMSCLIFLNLGIAIIAVITIGMLVS